MKINWKIFMPLVCLLFAWEGHAAEREIAPCVVYSNLYITVCDEYTCPSGSNTFTQSGTYLDTLTSSLGCDSVIQIHLTCQETNMNVTCDNQFFTSQAGTHCTFQWMDCNTLQPIIGETDQTFQAPGFGDYCVIVTNDQCVDTSMCLGYYSTNIEDLDQSSLSFVSSNPAKDFIVIKQLLAQQTNYRIISLTGKQVGQGYFNSTEVRIDVNQLLPGMYMLIAQQGGNTYSYKFIIR